MHYFTITHKIENYGKWKPVFDSDEARRQTLGIKTIAVMKGLEDENEITLVMSAPDIKTIEDRSHDDVLKQKMQEAGVISKPEFKIYKS